MTANGLIVSMMAILFLIFGISACR